MKKAYGAIAYNSKWAKEVGKAEFLKQMNENYPDRKEEHKKWADEHLADKEKATPDKEK